MSVAPATRVRLRVSGTVQGVGFRPHAYRLASDLGLAGWVRNDERGVVLEVEGDPEAVDRFVARLESDAPPLARVESVASREVAPSGERGFRIADSRRAAVPDAPVAPDSATCDECLAELFDPADRRHRYPFINCTNCGPRFTIVCGVPYDRPLTTMAGFEMCARCRTEYDDPLDRRFHAQPNACPQCGPALRMPGHEGDPLAGAVAALRDGLVVAVKGLGGFHLACRADDERVVAALRARKHREDKPFALMAGSLEAAHALVELGPPEAKLLADRARPIVIAPRRRAAPVAPSVAPRSRSLGVMLPYSPLHHLLLADAGMPLVMTSGNVSDEPIAYRDDEAIARLEPIADRFLLHDRPIETRTDDSVQRAVTVCGRPRALMLRRSRGHVPDSVALPVPAAAPVLACGAELKSTFCVARGRRAWVSHHVGDLANYETLAAFREGIARFERLFAVDPAVIAHDLHPGYLSTAYALDREGAARVGIQHHHAHLAAVLAEHGERGPAVGAIFDGTGYGEDGTVWGGEVLGGDLIGFERIAHLRPVRLPGGEQAIRQPWRMAAAWLREAHGQPPALPAALAGSVDGRRWEAVVELAGSGTASPLTSSAGRLFDAVAALCGLRAEVNYEGQAAAELESAADPREPGAYPLPATLDPRETVLAVARDVDAGVPVPVVAARFHNALARASARACAQAAEQAGVEVVVLSGGVFQNALLLERTSAALAASGLRVLVPERLPPNDGGISYGQAAIAAARTREGAS